MKKGDLLSSELSIQKRFLPKRSNSETERGQLRTVMEPKWTGGSSSSPLLDLAIESLH